MNEEVTRVCVTGAAGNLGGFTSSHLLEHTDFRLHLMTHRKPLNADLKRHNRVSVFKCDLGVKDTLVEVLTGVDVVVHYAGVLFQANPESFLPTTNVEYFRNLLEIARQQGVRKVILVSFPHVEGYTSPASPSTDRRDRTATYGQSKRKLIVLIARFRSTRLIRFFRNRIVPILRTGSSLPRRIMLVRMLLMRAKGRRNQLVSIFAERFSRLLSAGLRGSGRSLRRLKRRNHGRIRRRRLQPCARVRLPQKSGQLMC